MSARDRAEARRVFEQAIHDNPEDSWAHHHLGLLLEEEYQDFDGAINCYRNAVEANPENFCAWNSLGLRLKSRDFGEAMRCIEKALEIEPTYSRAIKNLALIHQYDRKDYAAAKDLFEQALAVDPNNTSVYLMLGLLLENQMKEHQLAEKCYQSAILADEWNPNGFFRLAILRKTWKKDFSGCKAYLEKAYALDPTDDKILYQMGRAEERAGNYQQAFNYLKQLLASFPNHNQGRNSMKWLLDNHADDIKQHDEDHGMGSPSSTTGTGTSNFDVFALDSREEETRVQCPQGHYLVRIKMKPNTYSARATWACEECKKSIGGPDLKLNGALYCKVCKYDLCNVCSKKERRSAHLLPQKPKLLGCGGFGVVYKEFDEQTSRYVAVKHISNPLAGSSVEKEVNLMKKFNENPHVVSVVRFERRQQETRVVMELMAGSLQATIEDEGAVHEAAAKHYIMDALKGLAALHEARPPIIHRDIKPDNLLLTSTGRVKISDFGLSKPMAAKTALNTMAPKGTPQFIPPEGFSSIPKWTPKSDIWALACSWITITTGRAPYDGILDPTVPLETIGWQFIQNPDLRPPTPQHLSPAARKLIDACFQTTPAARPSAAELLADPYFTKLDLGGMERKSAFLDRVAKLLAQRESSFIGGGMTTNESGSGCYYGGDTAIGMGSTVDSTPYSAVPTKEQHVSVESATSMPRPPAKSSSQAASRTRDPPTAPSSGQAVVEVRPAAGTETPTQPVSVRSATARRLFVFIVCVLLMALMAASWGSE